MKLPAGEKIRENFTEADPEQEAKHTPMFEEYKEVISIFKIGKATGTYEVCKMLGKCGEEFIERIYL